MNGHERSGEENEDLSSPTPVNPHAPSVRGLHDRLVAYVERYPGRRAEEVMIQLDASADEFYTALDKALAAGRIETRAGFADPDDLFLLTTAALRFWNDDATQPLFENPHERVAATHVIMFPGCTARSVVNSTASQPEDLEALAGLRRRGLVKSRWTLRGRRYEPSKLLIEWGREIAHVTASDGSFAAVAEAMRDLGGHADRD